MDEDSFVDKENLAAVIMEENNYEDHFKKLKSDQRKVERKINAYAYNANDVTVADKNEFRTRNARNEYGTFEDAADAVIDQLNAELEVIRVDELEALVSELSDMTKKNAVKE